MYHSLCLRSKLRRESTQETDGNLDASRINQHVADQFPTWSISPQEKNATRNWDELYNFFHLISKWNNP
jgi:hypothetical protein